MNLNRRSGLILHPTALPSPYGSGDFGSSARGFIDFLAASGMTLWQVLPLQHSAFDSPYDCVSSCAGNPLMISVEGLLEKKLLRKKPEIPGFRDDKVLFRRVIAFKNRILKEAFENFKPDKCFEGFCEKNSAWLNDYCDFMTLRERHGSPWTKWPLWARMRREPDMARMREKNIRIILRHKFIQYLFFSQWNELRFYARKKGVKIIGDMPMFVSRDSADVWAHKELFLLTKNGKPKSISGVPPDYFSKNGQVWGNPVYDWKAMKKNSFTWWKRRLGLSFEMFDFVRIDHFRGFYSYWKIPAGNKTAKKGRWTRVPGLELFAEIKKTYPSAPVIAEDLGYIPKPVKKFRMKLGFPGMKVLQFAFSLGDKNQFLPANYERNCVVYTGTHDNDTLIGWYSSCSPRRRRIVSKHLGEVLDLNSQMMELAMRSKAAFALFPMQDILGLGRKARFNTPGTWRGNWAWRMEEIPFDKARGIKKLCRLTRRK
ncbi:MAG: 4-alpha-glucanotransferase [Candidatus Omnitrophota bacterium]|nr:4-alpha-glucanotransferase [Candidatus Omnitrophota bacterium]MBU2529323.1 4-alpha-glucanotransferase [bacterium]MBU3930281.1 4-alpha-glucanotransferase [bacterium]MBU4122787.1 4-alpha-glucanotransferase [bacterium]